MGFLAYNKALIHWNDTPNILEIKGNMHHIIDFMLITRNLRKDVSRVYPLEKREGENEKEKERPKSNATKYCAY